MSLSLIDLRAAALREYPEFGEVPWPVPRCRRLPVLLLLIPVIELVLVLVLVLLIIR